MNRFLYSVFILLVFSVSCEAQTFLYQPNILEQYSAPRHIQYYNYGYYNHRTVVVDQYIPVPVRTQFDYYDYRPYYIQYNWTVPTTSRLPPNEWRNYPACVPFPYRY